MKYEFTKIDWNHLDVTEFHSLPDKTVLTTKEWIDFIVEDSKANPYIIRITQNKHFVGYFSALIVSKFGIKILGSPFPGWSTPFMGFDLKEGYVREDILEELLPYIIEETGCLYIQISDRLFDFDRLEAIKKKLSIVISKSETLELGIEGDDALQYKKMKTDCRNFIKQFERRGAIIEEVQPDDSFAEEYYQQLVDVFAKQNLVPTYTVEKVKCLLKHLAVSNMVYCLRVKNPEGEKIASSIYPGYNKKIFFWGGASLRSNQHFRPNEYMLYRAMSYWRNRGCVEFDMVGNRGYKKKFGSWEVYYPSITYAKYRWLIDAKSLAAKLYYFSGKVLWKLHINRH